MKHFFSLILLSLSIFMQAQHPQKILDMMDAADNYYAGDSLSKSKSFKTADLNDYFETITDYYRYYDAEKRIIKAVRIYHDNDLFGFYDNRDHEYTGGLRAEIVTDFLRVKLLSLRPDHKYLSYQTFFFGFEGYTPDTLNVFSPDRLSTQDRPFASFQYFGRSRNDISREGDFRMTSELKIGVIGGDFGRNFQRLIHRDITDSENNNGWDFQIANGGRLAIQYDLRYEWQLQLRKGLEERGKNVYFNYGLKTFLGFAKIAASPTLTLTNRSFFTRNPHSSINVQDHFGTQRLCDQIAKTWFYNISWQPELVGYNSMLQGYILDNEGFVFDPESQVNVKVPVIEEINSFVSRLSLGFGFRAYNSTFLFDYVILSPEYDYSFKDKAFHNYARLSLTMNL